MTLYYATSHPTPVQAYLATSHPTPVQAYLAWEKKREAWDEQRIKLGAAFGGKASSMFTGSHIYVGGIKHSTPGHVANSIHWSQEDRYGYRKLRTAPKLSGVPKEHRAGYVATHSRLRALWDQLCPDPIDSHEMWKGLGLVNGALQLIGMKVFELNGSVYISAEWDISSEVPGAVEILGSKFNEALARFTAGEGRRHE